MTSGALVNQNNDLNILGNSFKAVIHRLRTVEYECNRFTTPNIKLGSATQKNPFGDISFTGISYSTGEFSIRFRVNQKMENYMSIIYWMRGIGLGENFEEARNQFNNDNEIFRETGTMYSDISVVPLTKKLNPNMNWIFKNCFPVYLSELTFDTTDEDAVEQYAIASFEFTTFEVNSIQENPTEP